MGRKFSLFDSEEAAFGAATPLNPLFSGRKVVNNYTLIVLPANNPSVLESLPFPVTMCDPEGILIYMNPAAETLFAKDGGRALLGTSLFDCHSPESQEKIKTMMRAQTGNTYTIEKAGKKRLIHQSPWHRDGEFAGLVDISFEIPPSIPNFVRG